MARLLNNESETNEQRATIRHDVDRQNAAPNALSNETGPGGITMEIDQERRASGSEMVGIVHLTIYFYELHTLRANICKLSTSRSKKRVLQADIV